MRYIEDMIEACMHQYKTTKDIDYLIRANDMHNYLTYRSQGIDPTYNRLYNIMYKIQK